MRTRQPDRCRTKKMTPPILEIGEAILPRGLGLGGFSPRGRADPNMRPAVSLIDYDESARNSFLGD
jgi:hypothetical protein